MLRSTHIGNALDAAYETIGAEAPDVSNIRTLTAVWDQPDASNGEALANKLNLA